MSSGNNKFWKRDATTHSFSSVQFNHSVVSDYLRPHESQYARPPCPSPTPGVHPDSRPSSQWCHPAISSSVVPFSSCPQSLPASESFPMSQLFAWGGQNPEPRQCQMLVKMWSNRNSHLLLVKTQNGIATFEDSLAVSYKTIYILTKKWHPTPVFLPGKSHEWRSLVGYSPWGRKESDMTELLHFHFHTIQQPCFLVFTQRR